MSILSKCEEIGLELRQTEQGQLITKLHKEILQNPPELTVEFFKLIINLATKQSRISLPKAGKSGKIRA